MSEPDPNDTTGAQWESERQWLIDFMRQGLVMTSEAEKARVMAAMNRWETEVGDDLNRVVIHEAGHAVVAHALDWFVEYVEPQMPDGSGGAMTHQKRLEYSRLRSEWEQFLEQAAVAVAGYVAEDIAFGLALPYEAVELHDRAWEEHRVGDNHFGALVENAERRARVILTERWATVDRLAKTQLTGGRVEGDALAAILAGLQRN